MAVIVPDVVTGVEPIERVPFESDSPTDVTVPLPLPLPVQTPLIEKQPPARSIPLANVDVAEVPVTFRYDAEIPAPNVEVALPMMVVVERPLPAYRFPSEDNPVVEARLIEKRDGIESVTAPVD